MFPTTISVRMHPLLSAVLDYSRGYFVLYFLSYLPKFESDDAQKYKLETRPIKTVLFPFSFIYVFIYLYIF